MTCPYCKIEMDVNEWQELPAWRCKRCGHNELESAAYKLAGEPPITLCRCLRCRNSRRENPGPQALEQLSILRNYFGEPVLPLSKFCQAMETWSKCIIDNNVVAELKENPDKPERQHGYAYHDLLRTIMIDIKKSGLLSRLIYDGQKVRSKICPEHKGHMVTSMWCGLSEPCEHGCEGTGWLREPDDSPTVHNTVAVVRVGPSK